MKLGRGTLLRRFAPLAIGATIMVAAAGSANAQSAPSMLDVSFGVTATSDYISRGYTQTDNGPAIQPWIEFDYGMFYAGYWGSNVDGGWENDLSIGVRPMLGPVSLDLGYVRYIYSYGDCCGELYLKGSVNPVDPLTLGASLYYDPDAASTYVEANASYDFDHNISISGAIGSWDGEFSWNAGISWSPKDWLSFDGRYYGGVDADKFVVSVSLNSTWSMLKGKAY